MNSSPSVTRWQRTVTRPFGTRTGHVIEATVSHTEYLDMGAAAERLYEAMRERPDAGVSAWLDVALNGWGDDA